MSLRKQTKEQSGQNILKSIIQITKTCKTLLKRLKKHQKLNLT